MFEVDSVVINCRIDVPHSLKYLSQAKVCWHKPTAVLESSMVMNQGAVQMTSDVMNTSQSEMSLMVLRESLNCSRICLCSSLNLSKA